MAKGTQQTLDKSAIVSEPTRRIPARLPIGAHFSTEDGTSLDPEIWPGVTRDVSETGLCIAIPSMSPEVARKLEAHADSLLIDVDLVIGRQRLRVGGRSKWFRGFSKGDNPGCVVGIEYLDVDPKVSARLRKYAAQRQRRPTIIRGVAAALALTLAVGGLLYWQSYSSQVETITGLEEQLNKMEQLKGAIADKLQQAIEESNKSKRTQATVKATAEGRQKKLEERNQELRRVWQHFQEVQELVAELSSTLVSVNADPPEGLEDSAIHHQDRGYVFSLQNNQAAALIEFQRAVELDPYLAEAHREIGDIYDMYGRPALAIISYKRFVALEPDEEEAADMRQIIGELEESLKIER